MLEGLGNKTGFRTITAEMLVNIMHTHLLAFNFRFLANHNLVTSLKEQYQVM